VAVDLTCLGRRRSGRSLTLNATTRQSSGIATARDVYPLVQTRAATLFGEMEGVCHASKASSRKFSNTCPARRSRDVKLPLMTD
jgi:hypothetical protein